jgi:hypothetical protein
MIASAADLISCSGHMYTSTEVQKCRSAEYQNNVSAQIRIISEIIECMKKEKL